MGGEPQEREESYMGETFYACSAKRFNADMKTHPEWHGGKVVYQGYPVYKNLRLKGVM